ncbi:MAG: hypothetical protein E6H09_15310 [Bacteroidetes bacterium]|nr:MAG: hypothetical protein E6H09_15310 [Bacteroidota bacterium]
MEKKSSRRLYGLILLLLFFSVKPCMAQVPDSTAADSALLKQIESQMQQNNMQPVPQQTRSGINVNPDIGVIGDFQGSYISRGKKNFNAYLNETELSLQAVVDPYARADFFLSFGRDPETGKYGVEVEEGYLTTLSLPARLQLKAGKFKEAVGRINPMHAHALPFIDLPNAYVNYFGDGLNDEGASLSWLLPTKKVYQELIFQVTSGLGESPIFNRGENNRLIYLGHLKNSFTLNDNATLEIGLTGITGPNDSSRATNLGAADITYKWKPVKLNTYKSLTWQSELYYSQANYTTTDSRNSFGLYSFLQYQLAKRWFLTGRYDYAEKPYDRSIVEQAYSLTTGWYATEFSKIELEGKTTDDTIGSRYYQAWLRWIFVIGAHGAHQY